MSEEEQQRAQEGLTESAKDSSTALDDLTAAARRADQTFTGAFINKIPKTVSDVVGLLPGVGSGLSEIVKIAEARFQTLRQFTDLGANFNYNIETMSQTAINARMSLEEMAIFASKNSEMLAQLGTSVDSGLSGFTAQLTDLLTGPSREIERNLARLGFETDEMIQTFASYENQLVFSGVTERRSARERNQAAAEYAQTLDELAVLTGKQRDQIDQENREVATRGELMLFSRTLPEQSRAEFTAAIQEITQSQGQAVGLLLQDMLSTGIPLDQRGLDILNTSPELNQTMMEMRAALQRGATPQEMDRLKRLLNAQASEIMNSPMAQTLGVFRDLDYAGNITGVIEEQANAAAFQFQRIREELEAAGKPADDEDVQREIAARQEKRMASAQSEARTAYNTFIDSQIELERSRNNARQSDLDVVFGTVEDFITKFGDTIVEGARTASEDLNNGVREIAERIDNILAGVGSGFSARVNQALDRLPSVPGDASVELEADIRRAADALSNAADSEKGEIQARLNSLVDEAERLIRRQRTSELKEADFKITNAAITVTNQLPEEAEGPKSIGTLGTTGRLFQNFGTESLVPLHNLEAVLTPRQMGDVVQNSASGMARAILDQINTVNTNTIMSDIMTTGMVGQDQLAVMQGNLNSVLRSVRDTMTMNSAPTIDTSDLENEIRQIAAQMRRPLEEALNTAFKPHLEQLVSLARSTADSNERIQRNTKSISGTV